MSAMIGAVVMAGVSALGVLVMRTADRNYQHTGVLSDLMVPGLMGLLIIEFGLAGVAAVIADAV